MMGKDNTVSDILKRTRLRQDGCLLWLGGKHSEGYGKVAWKGGQRYAHHLFFELFNGPIPPGLFVLHRCDNRRCVHPDHLFLGTHQDNMADAGRKKRLAHGSSHWFSKLSEEDVMTIRGLKGHNSAQKIADFFGVARGTIQHILAGRTRKP